MAGRLTWIFILLAVALYGIASRPLVLGLDLQGGVTMRYELEQPGDLLPGETLEGMMAATVDTLRNRIDTYGLKESSITQQGENEVVIELPGSNKDDAETIKSVISRVGLLEFRIVMRKTGQDDDTRNNVSVATELQKLTDLLALPEHQGRQAEEIDVSTLQINLPDADLIYRWVPYSDKIIAQRRGADIVRDEVDMEALLTAAPLTTDDYEFLRIENVPEKTFTGADVQRAFRDIDQGGGAAVGITMQPSRASEFGDWTEPNIDRQMGITLDGRVAENPAVIQSRLEGRFSITSGIAGFTESEIKDYLTVIKSGSLKMKPRLMYQNTIGPSLGESSIRAGLMAMAAGFLAIIIFMIAYYRLNGLIAAICLLLNMVLLAGFLMFLGATLTLPGLAGLVLTLGMAVDANILIFERLREESDRAKSVSQAVKLGFEKAFSTIVDANVTTFVTAAILYNVGTGPVRGFAVILMLGILTSVFSVLVAGRVIFEGLLARGVESFKMGRLLKEETHIPFLSKGKTALRISGVLVVACLVAFFAADRDKYGLDFLGGYKAMVRLGTEATQGDINGKVGSVFPGAQVISVASDETDLGGEKSRFMVKLKASAEDAEQDDGSVDLESKYELPLKTALAGDILPDFVEELTLTDLPAEASTRIDAVVNFEPHPERSVTEPVVREKLVFLTDVDVDVRDPNQVALSGTWARQGLDEALVAQRLRTAFSEDEVLPPGSTPFLESTTIGSRVGTELRDSAAQAILLSFIAIVLYIRVRFREYRYGFAAIIAVAHDVAITLGIVALVHFTGVVDVEIDLAMIAAFLTIIGYSLNDTIVLFDRVRENLPRLTDKSFTEVLDISINQTLGRTLLTSTTTLVALAFIFIFNYGRQNVLEGFSFAMIIGVLVGTYSSIFVAAPVLTLLADGKPATTTPPARAKGGSKSKGAPAQQGAAT